MDRIDMEREGEREVQDLRGKIDKCLGYRLVLLCRFSLAAA